MFTKNGFIKSWFIISVLLFSMTSNAVELNPSHIMKNKLLNDSTNEGNKAIPANNAIAKWQKKLSDEGYYIGEINGLPSSELNRATKWYLRDRV